MNEPIHCTSDISRIGLSLWRLVALLFGAAAALAGEANLAAQDKTSPPVLIHLATNAVLRGWLAYEGKDHVILNVDKGSLRIPRTDIVRVERLPEVSQEELMRLREAAGTTSEVEEEAGRASTTPDAKQQERLRKLIAGLASEDPAVRAEARSNLEREGKSAVPALTQTLFSDNYFARLAAAELLGKLSARESVRDMLVALRSAIPDSMKVRPWQRQFVKALTTSLARITGQPVDIRERMADQDKAVLKLIEWWDGPSGSKEIPPKGAACVGWDTPQVGEPEIPEDDPERERKLWESRRVGTRMHAYRPPQAFVQNVFGEEAPWAGQKE